MLTLKDSLITALWKQQGSGEASDHGVSPGSCINIAINRQAGSGSSKIAQLVAERSGWDLYDHNLLARMAQERNLPQNVLEQVDERHVGWVEAMAVNFGGLERAGAGAYLHSLRAVLRELGKQGHSVIVGRGAAFLLSEASTLRVRLVAPRADRIARIQEQMGLSAKEAERWVDEKDRARRDFTRLEFGQDVEDPLAYDLLLNTSRLSFTECADIIVKAAQAKEADPRA